MLDSIFNHLFLNDGVVGCGGADSIAEHCLMGACRIILVAAFESIRGYTLALGIGGITSGVLLFINHKRHLHEVLTSDAAERIKTYETRKYRRRAVVSAMVTSVGCMLSALFWVSDAKVFSVFIMMIMSLLVGILGVALFDLFSVSLHQIATPDEKSQKALIEDYLKQREQAAEKVDEE